METAEEISERVRLVTADSLKRNLVISDLFFCMETFQYRQTGRIMGQCTVFSNCFLRSVTKELFFMINPNGRTSRVYSYADALKE